MDTPSLTPSEAQALAEKHFDRKGKLPSSLTIASQKDAFEQPQPADTAGG